MKDENEEDNRQQPRARHGSPRDTRANYTATASSCLTDPLWSKIFRRKLQDEADLHGRPTTICVIKPLIFSASPCILT